MARKNEIRKYLLLRGKIVYFVNCWRMPQKVRLLFLFVFFEHYDKFLHEKDLSQ